MSDINLIGWQSWSDCNSPNRKLPLRYSSPFGQNVITVPFHKIPTVNHKPPPRGWCSWHWFGNNISENTILDQARFIAQNKKQFPLEYILIDSGWCTWGDWLTPNSKKFPHNPKWLVKEIHKLGLKAGIWFAPLLATSTSDLYRKYPTWFIPNLEATKVSPLDVLIYPKRHVLDLQNPKVTKYLNSVVDYLSDCGFELFKLDFLYAGHFNPEFKTSAVPDNLLQTLLSTVHCHPSIYTIACGCPLAPAVGMVDAMRISDDINIPQLKYLWPVNHLIHTSRLNQLTLNLKLRQQTKVLWNLDPDAFICHPAHGLTPAQVLHLQSLIKSASGPIFLGDNLKLLSANQIDKFIYPLFQSHN